MEKSDAGSSPLSAVSELILKFIIDSTELKMVGTSSNKVEITYYKLLYYYILIYYRNSNTTMLIIVVQKPSKSKADSRYNVQKLF